MEVRDDIKLVLGMLAIIGAYWLLTEVIPFNPKIEGYRCGPPENRWIFRQPQPDLRCDKIR